MAAKIDCSKSTGLRDHLTNSVHSLMYLHPTSSFEILCVMKQPNFDKSCGLDRIDTKFVQLAAEVIALAFCLIFNACFEYEFFPTCLKEAKFAPVFKSGDKRKSTNFRPISLPCQNN